MYRCFFTDSRRDHGGQIGHNALGRCHRFACNVPWLFVKEGGRWVDEDEIVTSVGISAGIDMSLHLVEWLNKRELVLLTAKQLEFDKTENQPSV